MALTPKQKSQQHRDRMTKAHIKIIRVLAHEEDVEQVKEYARKKLKPRLKVAGITLHAGGPRPKP